MLVDLSDLVGSILEIIHLGATFGFWFNIHFGCAD